MATPKKPGLSKSRLIRGLQCPKSLYLTIHHPELEEETDQSRQAILEQGAMVGREAQKFFPKGVLVSTEQSNLKEALKLTSEAINKGANTLFEATFEHNGVLAKVDILNRASSRAGWRLIEVKSSTKVKDEHLDDVAIQQMVASGAGVKVKETVLMHLNNQCVAPDLSNLFEQENITKKVAPRLAEISAQVKALQKILAQPTPPDVAIGPHCSSPHTCGFKAHCWAAAKVPSPNIFDFPNSGKKNWEKFFNQGVTRLDDPRFGPFKGTDLKRIEAVRSGKRWVDSKHIAAAMADWVYPLYFLDFETFNPAIPLYDGTRPYQQLPFQFSVQVQQRAGAKLEEIAYLHDDASDPRGALSAALVEAIGPRGSVVAYGMSFESACLKGLAEAFPQFKKKLLSIRERLVDPWPILKAAVYDAGFMGSFSLKEVAPAILGAGAGYSGLSVRDGQMASKAFMEMVSVGVSVARRAELRGGLLGYCGRDTFLLGGLVAWLKEQI